MKISICPYCKSNNTKVFYRFNNLPILISAIPQGLMQYNKNYDFEASFCYDCSLGFNSNPLNKEELKIVYDNYQYISPSNNIGTTKYESIYNLICNTVEKNKLIVEIGCSDGYLLSLLKKNGYKNLIGIEPAPQSIIAKKNNIEIIQNYFSEEIAKSLPKVDVFIMMHVLEHFEDPFFVLQLMKSCLSKNGKIIIEVPDFSGFHHQHLFFFSSDFFINLSKDIGFDLEYCEEDMESSALRIILTNTSIKNLDKNGITQNSLKEKISKLESDLKLKTEYINELVKNKSEIYWWGAGSLSIIYLNMIDKNILNKLNLFIIDGDPEKWNKHISGTDLKVQSFTIIENREIELLIIASSFKDEIMKTISNFNIKAKEIKFLN